MNSTLTSIFELESFGKSNISNMFGENNTFQKAAQSGLVSSEARQMVHFVLEIGLSLALAFTGFIGNAMSLTTFAKMGYQESINISLSFICTWDLFRCVLGMVTKLYSPFQLISLRLSIYWHQYGMASLGFFAVVSGYVSTVLSAFVAVERCLCVSLPFTVRYLLTPKNVFMNNIVLSLVVVGSLCTHYFQWTISFVFNAELNSTVPRVVYTPIHYKHPEIGIYFGVITATWLVMSFVVICVSTAIIAFHLRNASEFKSKSTSLHRLSGENSKRSNSARDRQIIRMLFVIIALTLFTSLPRVAVFTCRSIFPEFDLGGIESNTWQVLQVLCTTTEFINYNTSIFVFYLMSSQFQVTFRRIFCWIDK